MAFLKQNYKRSLKSSTITLRMNTTMYSWEAIVKLVPVEHPCLPAISLRPGTPNHGVDWKLRHLGVSLCFPNPAQGLKGKISSLIGCVLPGSWRSKSDKLPGPWPHQKKMPRNVFLPRDVLWRAQSSPEYSPTG